MAETKHVVDPRKVSVFMATVGSGGHLVYISGSPSATGSGLTLQAKGLIFAGILDGIVAEGSYGLVDTVGIFNITKGNGTDRKIEQGEALYGSGQTAVSTSQINNGSVIGLAWEQSSSDTGSVAVKIQGMFSALHG